MSTYAVRIRRSLRGCSFRPSLQLGLFEEGFSLCVLGFWIALPFLDRYAYEPRDVMESWGVTYSDCYLHLNWGTKSKLFQMPWAYEHVGFWVLREDGTWAPKTYPYEGKEPDGRKLETHPYRYTLRSGEAQERTATIHVDRGEWRQRWLRWCPWFAKKRTHLNVEFSDEVGEKSGSWKGGCVGCGYEMRPGETPLDTLRRMERERTF